MKFTLKNTVSSSIVASLIFFGLNGILHATDHDGRSSMGQSSSQGSSMSGGSSSGQESAPSQNGRSIDPSEEPYSSGDKGMAPTSTGSDNAPGPAEQPGAKRRESSSATGQPSPQGSSSSDQENMRRNY
ncbi:hypothetical protein [Nitrosomonas communis]|uniref:hypothetical protein n=1 Tax=Nitrosomonas communis TaxID=44574 RepID=UPI00111540EB|nr:hypothetical protein [Nitrosomonas communis]